MSQKIEAQPDQVVQSAIETLRWYESELRKEPSHYTRKINHGPVTARIHRKLRNARQAIQRMLHGGVDPAAGERFIDYITSVIAPLLQEKGSPFDVEEIATELRSRYAPVTV